MKPRHFVLTKEEIAALEESIRAINKEPMRNRLRAVLLYGTGIPVMKIQKEVKCSRSILIRWCQIYRTKGIQGLEDGRIGGNNKKLSQEQVDELAKRLVEYTPKMVLGDACSTPEGKYWTVKDTLQAIEVWYAVTYKSRGSYYNVLERAGIELEELSKPLHNTLRT